MYLSGLGVSVGDLPKGGINLRLYTYDPVGSAFYKPPGQGYQYNTGHYDLSLPGGPCSQTDAQGFPDWQSMSTYAGGKGESSLVLVSRDDLPALCSARPAAALTPAPGPFLPPAPPSSEAGGGTFRIPTRTSPSPIFNITPGGGGGGPIFIPSPGGGPAPGSDGGIAGALGYLWPVAAGVGLLYLLARR